jgi:hypothetical protein
MNGYEQREETRKEESGDRIIGYVCVGCIIVSFIFIYLGW